MRDKLRSSVSTLPIKQCCEHHQMDLHFPEGAVYIRVMRKDDPRLKNVPEPMLESRTFYALRGVKGQDMYISDDRNCVVEHAEEKEKILLTLQ
jgi:hypothetical protein